MEVPKSIKKTDANRQITWRINLPKPTSRKATTIKTLTRRAQLVCDTPDSLRDSLFQALCQRGRLKKRRGREGLVEKEGAPFPFHSRIPLAADPACRPLAFSIVLSYREPGRGYLRVENKYLERVFHKNNYNADFIRRNIYRPTEADATNRNPTTATRVIIPYIKGKSKTISRILQPQNTRVVLKPTTTLRQLLTKVNWDRDEPNNRQGAVYKIQCSDC